MVIFQVRNTHAALPIVLSALERDGVSRESRNGPVLVFPTPVTICYEAPLERVIFWSKRDANPFFSFFESLYFLAGRDDVEFLKFFVSDIDKYSDDKRTFWDSYGYRWRTAFSIDQLNETIENLRVDQTCRRQVIQMWDTEMDLTRKGVAVPCNLCTTVQINSNGCLDLTVFNRSNDIIFGALGSNSVTFSVLQEYLASSIGVPVGRYWQVSVNMHVYQNELWEKCKPIIAAEPDPWRKQQGSNPYDSVRPYPLFPPRENSLKPSLDAEKNFFDDSLDTFFTVWKNPGGLRWLHPFFREVAVPMMNSYLAFKQLEGVQRYINTKDLLKQVAAEDWRLACWEWIDRREQKWMIKQETVLNQH